MQAYRGFLQPPLFGDIPLFTFCSFFPEVDDLHIVLPVLDSGEFRGPEHVKHQLIFLECHLRLFLEEAFRSRALSEAGQREVYNLPLA